MNKPTLHEAACQSENCTYRRLYEGSQVSLADMAARQGQALSRVGRLRSSIVTALRRNFPSLAGQAEAQTGRRLADVDDEILLAYLDAFIASDGVRFPYAVVSALREALSAQGLTVLGDDIADWPNQIARQTRPRPARPTRSYTPPQPAPTVENPVPLGQLFSPAGPATQEPRPRGPLPRLAQTHPPVADVAPHVPLQPETPPVEPVVPTQPTPDVQHEPLGPVPRNRPGRRKDARRGADSTGNEASTAATTPVVTETAVPLPGNPHTRDDASGDGGTTVEATPTEPDAQATAQTSEAPSGGSAPASAEPMSIPDLWEGALGDAVPTTDRWSPSPVRARSSVDYRAAPPPAVDPLPAASAAATHPDGDASTPLEVIHEPLRPQLVPQQNTAARKRRAGKQLRTQAQAPDGELRLDVPIPQAPAAPLTLDDGMTQALLAAASIPRPVFTRDLVAIAGTPEIVDAWESVCRADPVNYPVRFIAPKSRHRMRGSLVFTEAKSGSGGSWWPRCVEAYRGARLYELGVLLNRVGDEIVSVKFHTDTAVMRLNTPRGLVGILIVMDSRLEPGEPVREELGEGLSELLSERLSLIAVLTTNAEQGSLESLISSIGTLAQEHGWQPTAPVVAARSWEYADDRGTTAVLALGG